MENMTTDKVQDLSKSELKYISDTFKLLSLFEYSFGKHEIELASAVLEDAGGNCVICRWLDQSYQIIPREGGKYICQSVSFVWRLLLHSEVQFGNLTRAKGIFYRALQLCPWSKALYLDAVSLLTKDKIEEIVDLMTEKEIRLQIPLEEVDILMEDATDNNSL
ncbi:unnamed protein product [Mytilus coruscus]|uniref:Uncharacterized protein n=1 Tax=Mytilus coruscus TaxID=42192 RepID=A0A6J8A7A4_MYTCO|nr:unnamed protein product [Mytilus coruscus]